MLDLVRLNLTSKVTDPDRWAMRWYWKYYQWLVRPQRGRGDEAVTDARCCSLLTKKVTVLLVRCKVCRKYGLLLVRGSQLLYEKGSPRIMQPLSQNLYQGLPFSEVAGFAFHPQYSFQASESVSQFSQPMEQVELVVVEESLSVDIVPVVKQNEVGHCPCGR